LELISVAGTNEAVRRGQEGLLIEALAGDLMVNHRQNLTGKTVRTLA
jgi:hypothetical protein